jgi:predicted phage baseplate assembly protein
MSWRTHADFDAAMRAVLDRTPGLAGLRARTVDDPTIALIDAWAVALDVLSFYQERITVEGFLGTATEDRSVHELADTVGYRPSPGLSAGCLLAFTLEDGVGAPASVTLDAGLAVQSLPGPGELPQTYETLSSVEARPEWNAVPAVTVAEAKPAPTELNLPGVVTDIRPGDALLFLSAAAEQGSVRSADWAVRLVDAVGPLPGGGPTRVAWSEPVSGDFRVYLLRQRAAVFGHNAPDFRSMPADLQTAYQDPLRRTGKSATAVDHTAMRIEAKAAAAHRDFGQEWPASRFRVLAPATSSSVDLDSVYPAAIKDSWAVLGRQDTVKLYRITDVGTTSRTDFTLTAKVTRLTLDGHDIGATFGGHVRDTVVLVGSQRLTLAPIPVTAPVQDRTIALAKAMTPLTAGRLVIATGRRARLAVADNEFTLTLQPAGGGAAVVLRPGEVLQVTGPSGPVGNDNTRQWPVLRSDGSAGTVRGTDAQLPAVPAPDTGATIAEAALVVEPMSTVDLTLAAPLVNAYDRSSFRLLANVVAASHGQTRTQVLGSGDASATLQSFVLAIPPDPGTGRAPLAYLRSTRPGGAVSTLEVVVSGVRWHEVRSLFDAGPREQVYVVCTDPDGRIRVQFGDGVTGARLPSGTGNVTATYRVGTGRPGMVGANRITLLTTRPLGVRSVTNPLGTDLAADPESTQDMRRGIPRTALTLDRVVSLVDYAEAARSFAGIAKATARSVWEGEARVVRITVAAAGGLAVDKDTRQALVDSLATADPFQRLRVYSYTPVRLGVTAVVVAAPGWDSEPVRTAIEATLRDTFSFDRRDFEQPLGAGAIEAAIQGVPGVLGVQSLTLDPQPGTDTGGAVLRSINPDALAITVQETR